MRGELPQSLLSQRQPPLRWGLWQNRKLTLPAKGSLPEGAGIEQREMTEGVCPPAVLRPHQSPAVTSSPGAGEVFLKDGAFGKTANLPSLPKAPSLRELASSTAR